MVDAINGGSNIKPKDLTINWKECTASEVIEYKDEGQEIPSDILVWAQDMAKTDNADEITYEMSMEGVDPENAADEETDVGTAMKNQLDKQGVSTPDQAKIFKGESDNYSSMIDTLENEMSTILEQSEAASTNVQDYTNNLLSQIQSLQARQEKMKSDKNSQFGALDAAQLDAQIRQLGNLGLSNIESSASNIYSVTNGIGDALNTAVEANAMGATTVSVGQELYNYSTTYKTLMGLANSTINSGNNAINQAKDGTQYFNSTADDNKSNEEVVNDSKNSVIRASGATGAVNAEEENTPTDKADETDKEPKTDDTTQNVTDKFEQDREAKKEESELDPTLADTSITSDPTEILKRKERKGLV